MFDVNDLRSYWRDYPPVHVLERWKLAEHWPLRTARTRKTTLSADTIEALKRT